MPFSKRHKPNPVPGRGCGRCARNKEGVIVRNRQVEQLVRLTQACLTRYWQLDCEYVLQYLDRDVIWIGSAAHQFVEGREATAADLRRSMEEIQPCHLLHQAFLVAQNAGNACTIVGRYLTTTDDEVGYCLQAQQRCTVTWELGEAGPKIKCLHVSNPMGELKLAEGETFVNVLGQTTRKYIQDRLQGMARQDRIPVVEEGGNTCFLRPGEIVSVMAEGRSCVIHCLEGRTIRAKVGFSEFLHRVGPAFYRIHRSYAVNGTHLVCIRPYEVEMVDGNRIPIPVKRYRQVRDTLLASFPSGEEGASPKAP